MNIRRVKDEKIGPWAAKDVRGVEISNIQVGMPTPFAGGRSPKIFIGSKDPKTNNIICWIMNSLCLLFVLVVAVAVHFFRGPNWTPWAYLVIIPMLGLAVSKSLPSIER